MSTLATSSLLEQDKRILIASRPSSQPAHYTGHSSMSFPPIFYTRCNCHLVDINLTDCAAVCHQINCMQAAFKCIGECCLEGNPVNAGRTSHIQQQVKACALYTQQLPIRQAASAALGVWQPLVPHCVALHNKSAAALPRARKTPSHSTHREELDATAIAPHSPDQRGGGLKGVQAGSSAKLGVKSACC